MINHLKTHSIEIKKISNESPTKRVKPSAATPQSMLDFIRRESLNEILAKCAAKDGFSFRSMVKSEAIRGYVTSRNYTMPKSAVTIQNYVMQFFNEKREEMKIEISNLLKADNRFSITVDEWTDILMRRYLNVTIHSKTKDFVLGLIHIQDRCTSEKTKELMTQGLLEFGIKLDTDIVASTHDGASVMVKYGQIIEVESQLCYNHAIHLAVVKVLYKNKNFIDIETESINQYEEDDADFFLDYEDDEEDISFGDENLLFENTITTAPVIRENVKISLDKMRKIIKFFKKSTVRTEILNKQVISQEGKVLKLMQDCKTRWNTLVTAVTRFLKLRICVNLALEELGAEKFPDENIAILVEVESVLEPLMLAVKELSKQNSDLITAEGTLIYVFQKLKKVNTTLSTELLETLTIEIGRRRNKEVISLLLFLHHGSYPKSNEFFSYSTKIIIKLSAKKIISRLYSDPAETLADEADDQSSSNNLSGEVIEIIEKTAYDELRECVSSFTAPKTITAPIHQLNIEKEFKLSKANGKRTASLDYLYRALITISPTSTTSERVFSVAGNIITKLRSRLDPKTLNALLFLKYYFTSNK